MNTEGIKNLWNVNGISKLISEREPTTRFRETKITLLFSKSEVFRSNLKAADKQHHKTLFGSWWSTFVNFLPTVTNCYWCTDINNNTIGADGAYQHLYISTNCYKEYTKVKKRSKVKSERGSTTLFRGPRGTLQLSK